METFETGVGPRVEYGFAGKTGSGGRSSRPRSPVRNHRGEIEGGDRRAAAAALPPACALKYRADDHHLFNFSAMVSHRAAGLTRASATPPSLPAKPVFHPRTYARFKCFHAGRGERLMIVGMDLLRKGRSQCSSSLEYPSLTYPGLS